MDKKEKQQLEQLNVILDELKSVADKTYGLERQLAEVLDLIFGEKTDNCYNINSELQELVAKKLRGNSALQPDSILEFKILGQTQRFREKWLPF